MQFIFDLIWNQSRTRFLATIGEQEVGQWSSCRQLSSPLSAWPSSPPMRWMPTAPA